MFVKLMKPHYKVPIGNLDTLCGPGDVPLVEMNDGSEEKAFSIVYVATDQILSIHPISVVEYNGEFFNYFRVEWANQNLACSYLDRWHMLSHVLLSGLYETVGRGSHFGGSHHSRYLSQFDPSVDRVSCNIPNEMPKE
tara:strand:+ start:1467 stop:1880 length:414 start_codon:yes stop_codon:yes gene_type:complete